MKMEIITSYNEEVDELSVENLTIDEIFEGFDIDRDTKLVNLKDEKVIVWKQDDYDRKCDSELHNIFETYNKTLDNPLRSKYYICINCRTLMKLIDIRNPFDKNIIELENGNKICIKLIKYKNIRPEIVVNPKNTSIILSSRYDINIKKIISCDSFTLNMLISWILANIFSNHEVKMTEKIIKNFICNNNGYIIKHVRPKQLREGVCHDNIEDIILQLKLICKILGNYDYYHGNYSLENINFYKYNRCIPSFGRRKFRIAISIFNFHNSAITFDNIRLMKINKEQEMKVDIINFGYNALYNNINICGNYFKIKYNEFTDYMFSNGIHNFKVEYNFYSFVIALCENDQFFLTIKRTKLWYIMWKREELRILEDRIYNSKLIKNYDTKIILSNISLKINILDDIDSNSFV